MRQEYPMGLHEYHTSLNASQVKVSSCGVHDLVAENARAQEIKEQQTSELAPGAYMMGKIVESNGSRYRSGRDGDGRYMTTDDYANLYRSRRVCHVNEQESMTMAEALVMEKKSNREARPVYAQENTQRTQSVHRVRESDPVPRNSRVVAAESTRAARPAANRPVAGNAQGARQAGKARAGAPMPPTVRTSAAPAVRREPVAQMTEWSPSGERYIRVRNQKRFPIAMVMMIVAVSVSLMLIVFGSVMTSHMNREVIALENELEALNELAHELEGELALKNDPVKMEQLATELGMVRAEYVQTRILHAEPEEYTVVYETTEEVQPLSFATLLSAIGFFKD